MYSISATQGNVPVLNLPENTGILLSESLAPLDRDVKTTTAVKNKVLLTSVC